jgi:hypothetical protein
LKNRRKLYLKLDEKEQKLIKNNDKNIFIQNLKRSVKKIKYYFGNKNEEFYQFFSRVNVILCFIF